MSKIFIITLGLMLAFETTIIAPAYALLMNADFDSEVGLTGTQWAVFDSIPGWTKTTGPGIEVQHNTVVTAFSGDQYIELDSHPAPGNSGMFQSVFLDPGVYDLSFYYQPRTNNLNDNGINFGVTGVSSWMVDATTGTWSGWQQVSQTLTIVSADNYDVFFSAYGDFGTSGGNTLGGFVDSVSLNPVPEPATMLLLGTGLAGVAGIISRRRKK